MAATQGEQVAHAMGLQRQRDAVAAMQALRGFGHGGCLLRCTGHLVVVGLRRLPGSISAVPALGKPWLRRPVQGRFYNRRKQESAIGNLCFGSACPHH